MAEEEDKAPTDEELGKPEAVVAEPEVEEAEPAEEAKMVPHQALHEEREKRKELAQKLQTLEQQYATGDQRLAELSKRWEEREAAERAWSEPQWDEDDPTAQAAVLRKEIQDFRNEAGSYIEQQRTQAQEQQLSAAYHSAKSQFEAQNPDADAALSHLWNVKRQEYRAYGVPEQNLEQIVNHEFKNIVAHNLRTGRNPVEAMYQSARLVGYQQQVAESAADQIDRIDRGQQAGKSLSQTGGKPVANLSMKTLGAMSDEDFAKLSDEDFKRVMGG